MSNNNNRSRPPQRPLFFVLLGGGLLLAASALTTRNVSTSPRQRVGAASPTCSSLQASTAAPPIPTTSPHHRVKTAETAVEEGLLEPTGVHHPFYSLSPLTEARAWAAREGQYFNGLIEANGGASVFKGHPGLAVTFLTDHASCEWFLSQNQDVLDRQ
ncbi:unnamed protein product, partial [Ectocarpus sp. 12 AP-2014]